MSAGPLPGLASAPPGCVVRLAGSHVEDVRRVLGDHREFTSERGTVPTHLGTDDAAAGVQAFLEGKIAVDGDLATVVAMLAIGQGVQSAEALVNVCNVQDDIGC